MLNQILGKVFGTKHERDIKRMQPRIDAINELEPSIAPLSDEQLRAKTDEFRARLEGGETLDDLLIETFAVVREAAKRTVAMRHFDVQLAGGIVLHEGKIAEMKTGEGKTLVATLPVYLNALAGKGVHVVTVNDYLARRDADWMAQVYRFLGLTVGVIQNDLPDQGRQEAYAADITYGTNNEFGFDYLRDNMKFDRTSMVHAAALLRHRGRGRLDPDRRGADAADHLRPIRAVDREVLPDRQGHPPLEAGGGDRARRWQQDDDRRLPGRREGSHRDTHRRRRQLRGAPSRARESLRHGQHGRPARRQSGPAGAQPLQARCRLPGQGQPRWSSSTSSPGA